MGRATGSTSLLVGAGRNGAYIQQRTTAPFSPLGACSSTFFYPFPIVVGEGLCWEEGKDW